MQASGWQSNGQVDLDFIRETVRSLAAVVQREYFDPDVAARVDEELRARLDDGRYSEATTLESLAAMLTDNLYELTSDKHLAVTIPQPKDSDPATGEANNDLRRVRGRRSNFGVEHIQILTGNVGYLNITYFFRPDEARDAIAAAMQSLRYADALVVDMRTNAGGSPGTVALLASYFFDAPGLLLFEIIPRSGARDGRYSTEDPAVPNRDGMRPLYILTSEQTFSAGEGLAFIVQERQRGEIVGEKTAGAANPGRQYPVNPHFEVTVPNGRVRMALTGRNWEGIGVTPEIAVPASEALHVAHIRALRTLLSATPNGSRADSLRRELKALEAERTPR
jgi:C-terminal processing protease CtpA/Prc